MDIPLSAFLIGYVAVTAMIIIFGLLSLSQALRFGMRTAVSQTMNVLFVIVTLIIVVATWFAVWNVDWGTTFTISLPSFSEKVP